MGVFFFEIKFINTSGETLPKFLRETGKSSHVLEENWSALRAPDTTFGVHIFIGCRRLGRALLFFTRATPADTSVRLAHRVNTPGLYRRHGGGKRFSTDGQWHADIALSHHQHHPPLPLTTGAVCTTRLLLLCDSQRVVQVPGFMSGPLRVTNLLCCNNV